MQFTHLGHSCVLLELDGVRILIDPGTLSTVFEGERDLDAVLVTHQHPDHVDTERLPQLLDGNPDALFVHDSGTASAAEELGLDSRTVRPGDSFSVGTADNEVAVHVVGGEHAVIHPDLSTVPNVGYIVQHGAFYHPGDSFAVPEQRIDVLGLPTGAPWLKASEAVDFLRAVEPRVAVPIHDAVLAYPEMHYSLFNQLAPEGTDVLIAPTAESVSFD